MRWGAGIEYSLVQVHLLLEVFLCGRRIRTYTFWAPTRRGSKPLRAVRAAGVLVPGVLVRWSVVSPLERELQTVGGVLAEGVIDAAVRIGLLV